MTYTNVDTRRAVNTSLPSPHEALNISMKHDGTTPALAIKRYPPTSNRSLQAWSAADELLLETLANRDLSGRTIAIYEDRFGYLSAHLHRHAPWTIVSYRSQRKALEMNLGNNGLSIEPERWISPLDPLPRPVHLAIVRVPKSLDLFRLYLAKLAPFLDDDAVVLCPFMTRHFSPQMLAIAGEYFEVVEQSLARKKARLLILEKPRTSPSEELINVIDVTFEDDRHESLGQYYGVFSAGHVDYATQFLLQHLELRDTDHKILDLASGNGVIARAIQRRKPDAELHLLDDFLLAIESSRLNMSGGNVHFHWADSLDGLPRGSFDLVVSNPPFHFDHENNIEIPLRLFQQTAAVLEKGGRFVCVANRHLNYRPHLQKLFRTVTIPAQNERYVIYACVR
jgi:23S rRNA (guanine1835-N2)-methyltransferase